MTDGQENLYDIVPYPSHTFPQTHPDRLATAATLFGMQPAPVEACRVLELGCGDGGNLIPMALEFPNSEFVGIDSAAVPLARGRSIAEQLGLENIVLQRADILEVSPDFGQFDYIIAHGIFSWVPAQVQEKILAISRANLAPQGVAYVSYNTYPGMHFRQMVREMMLFHVGQFQEHSQKITQARALVKYLLEAQADSGPYRLILESELEDLVERKDEAIFHDELAEFNSPVYFHQFMERATRQGLRYLAEADFVEMRADHFPQPIRDGLGAISADIHAREQYLDFLRFRRFRQTLLCHQEVGLTRTLNREQVKRYYASARLEGHHSAEDIHSDLEVQFVGSKNASIKTTNRLVKAALTGLNRLWPQALHFDGLLSMVRTFLHSGSAVSACPGSDESAELAELILAGFCIGLVELRTSRPRLVGEVSERPVASPLARLQARRGSSLTTLRHNSLVFEDDLLRHLVRLLDGTRDHEILLAELISYARSRMLTAHADAQPQELHLPTREGLEGALSTLARSALLVG